MNNNIYSWTTKSFVMGYQTLE